MAPANDPDPAGELRIAERALQAAQLAGDVAELDRLIDDRLVYTGPPDGGTYSKADDLANHRSGIQSMSAVTEEELRILVDGRTGVTWFLGTLAGSFAGHPFETRLRYTRTWIRDDALGWRIIAVHASEAPRT